jgi:phosphoglycerol transferase MdoB-like AlkP superfamily enzyme
MFKELFYPIRILLKRLSVVLLGYFILRILFFLFNYEIFGKLTFKEALLILIGGLRFDITTIIYYNLIFITLSVIIHPAWHNKWFQGILAFFFFFTNGFAYLIAVSDLIYYRFNNKRIAADILGMTDAFVNQFYQFLSNFWYLFVIFFLFIALNIWFYKRIRLNKQLLPRFWIQPISAIVVFGFAFLGARGGWQTIPITPIKAAMYADVNNMALVTNSPYTFIFTINRHRIDECNYYSKTELLKHFEIKHTLSGNQNGKKDNIVIILLESFSKEFVGALNNNKGYTPFFDSLCNESLVFPNAFANSQRSAKAITSILGSFPSLIVEDYMRSRYQDNCFIGLGKILKTMNYQTAFFHGGINGEFEIDKFARNAGFDKYYGRNEFNNEKFFDGNWGIYDEEFFQYTIEELNNYKPPFCAVLFSLSSHHPFNVPKKYKGIFPKGHCDVIESIGYTDFALKKFFESASKTNWFNNTLFIVTADHTYGCKTHLDAYYGNKAGTYAIPFLLFKPSDNLKGIDSTLVQQIDILPTILEYIGYKGNYISFGVSVFSKDRQRFAIQDINDIFQIIDKKYIYIFNGDNGLGLYDYKNDKLFENNLLQSRVQPAYMETYLKAVIQTYNYCLIHNTLCTGVPE